MRSARSLFCSWLFSSWQLTVTPVGMCVMRTAESVVLTLCPPGPRARKMSMRRSLGWMSTSMSSASGSTATVAVEVWMRPAASVAGHALHAVHAALVLERRVGTLAAHLER